MNDAHLIAADAVLECASLLVLEATALVAASSSADPVAIENRLRRCRSILIEGIRSWREADQVEALREAAE